MNYTPQAGVPAIGNGSQIDQQISQMLDNLGQNSPGGIVPKGYDPEIVNPGSSSRAADIPNIQDAQFSDIPNPQFQPNSPVPYTYNPEVIPPNQINGKVPDIKNIMEGEWSNVAPELQQLLEGGKVPQLPEGMKLPEGAPDIQSLLNQSGNKFMPTADELQHILSGGAEAEIPGATESTAHPNPTSELPDEFPSGETVYPKMPFDSPLLQASKQLAEAQKPQWLQRLQDAMSRWGIMGSGLESSFMKNSGASDIIKNALAGKNNGDEAIQNYIEQLAKETGQSGLNDVVDALHKYEAGEYQQGSNKTFDELLRILHHGVPGTQNGRLAEEAAGVASKQTKDNYFPLRMNPKDMTPQQRSMMDAAASNDGTMRLNKGNFDQTYNLDRHFDTTAKAQEAGWSVHDPFTSVAKRLLESNRDVSMANMYKELEQAGYMSKVPYVSKTPGSNMVRYFSKDGSKLNALNGKYVNKDLAGTLNTMFDRMPWTHANIPIISPALQHWDKATQFYRNATLYTPMVHLHNVFGNALMGAGISPADYLAAESMMKDPNSTVLKWAQKTGALGEHYGQPIESKINSALGNASALDKLKAGYSKVQNATLWNREKALRLGVFNKYFQEAVKGGASAADAANVARDATLRHMVDYSSNNLSTFEKEIMTRIDPFYRWHRGNYALQASKMMSDPQYIARTAAVHNVLDKIQRDITGHGLAGNLGGDTGGNLQIPLDGNGNYVNYDTYLPWEETGKLASQNPANTLFNRMNPFMRETMNQATNNQFYPMQAVTPIGKDYMTGGKYEIRNPATSGVDQGISTVKHAFSHTILPEDQAIPSAIKAAIQGTQGVATGKYPEVPAWMQLAADLSGGFAQSSPTSQNKINAQQHLEKKWLDAYKKAAQKGR